VSPGDKSKYTDKQERKADHIAESYEERGVSEKEAERRAWATVNRDDGGGKKEGGPGVASTPAIRQHTKEARRGGKASADLSAPNRSESQKKAATTPARQSE
jgi:plasmid stabilization system protein ParE